jgi:hypothetical protein
MRPPMSAVAQWSVPAAQHDSALVCPISVRLNSTCRLADSSSSSVVCFKCIKRVQRSLSAFEVGRTISCHKNMSPPVLDVADRMRLQHLF